MEYKTELEKSFTSDSCRCLTGLAKEMLEIAVFDRIDSTQDIVTEIKERLTLYPNLGLVENWKKRLEIHQRELDRWQILQTLLADLPLCEEV